MGSFFVFRFLGSIVMGFPKYNPLVEGDLDGHDDILTTPTMVGRF
jgi:hypothetical protein